MATPFPIKPRPIDTEFGPIANSQAFGSPLNKATQTTELPGTLWAASLRFDGLTDGNADDDALIALLAGLNGRSGRFELWDHRRESPRGIYDSGSDTPLVMGADQTGKSLITDGWRTSQTGLLLPRDYFEVAAGGQKRLFMVTAQVDSDGSGVATISFTPALTPAPADNAPLNFVRASAVFMLTSDDQPRIGSRTSVSSLIVDCIEAF